MELDKIERLIEKYFQGETSIAEEKELKKYFSSRDVTPHLKQYESLFRYFSVAKQQKSMQETASFSSQKLVKRNKIHFVTWLSVAASVIVLLGIGTYGYFSYQKEQPAQELGTYEDPKVAFEATQKALAMLSGNVNVGIESVRYIKEYDNSKQKIFNQ